MSRLGKKSESTAPGNFEAKGSETKPDPLALPLVPHREHSPCFSHYQPSEPTRILPVLHVGPTVSLDFPGNSTGLPFSYSKH